MAVTRLRVFRVQSGLSIKDFANKHGLSAQMLNRMELGQAYIPPHWRERLADALGVSVSDICDPQSGWPKQYEPEQRGEANGARNRLDEHSAAIGC